MFDLLEFNIQEHVNIAEKTTFKIGGTSKYYAEPKDSDEFVRLVKALKENNVKYFILGGGSNIVFQDGEFDGAVISTSKMNGICISENSSDEEVFVCCCSGASVASFVAFCKKNDLWGAEKFAGLPGSIGGALYMNARCFEKSISELFVLGIYFDFNEEKEKKIDFNENDWDYKKSPFQKDNLFISSAVFKLKRASSAEHKTLELECRKYIEERKSKGHFEYPSAGSVFKNNHDFGAPSGRIIDECGLRGKRIGNAQIAEFHGNFIVNLGGATQKDVRNLVEFVVNEVKNLKGFQLQPEIIFI